MTNISLKAYVLVNRYMQGVQAGIQGAHAFVELANWRQKSSCKTPMKCVAYDEWADKYKTMIFLSNGGRNQMKVVLEALRSRCNQHLPYGAFYETDLGEKPVLTSIALIMPDARQLLQSIEVGELTSYSDPEISIIQHVAEQRLI